MASNTEHPSQIAPLPLPIAMGNASQIWELRFVSGAIAELRFINRVPVSWMVGPSIFGVLGVAFGAPFVWSAIFTGGGPGTPAGQVVLALVVGILTCSFPIGRWFFLRQSIREQLNKMPEGGVVARHDRTTGQTWIWPGLKGGRELREVVNVRMRSGHLPVDGPGRSVFAVATLRGMMLVGEDAETGETIATTVSVKMIMGDGGSEVACEAWARAAKIPMVAGNFSAVTLD